ncbi:MAG: CHAD domain-containing protein [Solirubrobacterales bacterium]
MAKPRLPELSCEQPFGAAAATVVELRAEELLEHSDGVLDTDDVERVHDMRVASRRLRAAMEVFEPCFPRKRFRTALKEVKAVADALGERRDRDVSIGALERFCGALAGPDPRGVQMMVERLREEQLQANEGLAPFVDPRRLSALRGRIAELAAAAERRATG